MEIKYDLFFSSVDVILAFADTVVFVKGGKMVSCLWLVFQSYRRKKGPSVGIDDFLKTHFD